MGFEEAANVMARNSTACAMEWSIELEKALRSKNPGRCIEAISQIGARLEQWAGDAEGTMVIYDMFGLVPGEDRLFANTIFLRLADAFQLGNVQTRATIVKVFLSLFRRCKDKKRIRGILSKSRVHNHSELLRRVKVVFDSGDVESRALALALFGCWADFAKDSAQIRYLILSTLVSSNVLEVRASLFAAGCFSELADDFASVVLEMLVNILTSSGTLSAVQLAAARAFAKMGFSNSIASKAYKTGLKLVLDSAEEDFLVAMLPSLSKLCHRSTVLISEQVDYLLLVLNGEISMRMRATALRCLHFISIKGMCQSLIGGSVIRTLLMIIDDPECPSNMHCEALKILHKIVLCTSDNLACLEMHEFSELLKIVDKASQSPIFLKSFQAIRILVDVVIGLQRITEMGTVPLPSQLVTLIMDQIALLVKPCLDLCQFNHTVFQNIQRLLSLILILVRKHPDLGILVLDKVHLFIEHLANIQNSGMAGRQADSEVNDIMELKGERGKAISSKLSCFINRFVVSCLESLNEAGTIAYQVFDKVKLLVEFVHGCSLFNCYAHTIYSLLLHSQLIWGGMIDRNVQADGADSNSHIFCENFLVKHELFTLESAKRMLTHRDNWPAYKAGIYAACHGAWVTATFIFGQLTKEVQSYNYCCWLKSLYQLAHSEKLIQVLLLPKAGPSSMDWLEMKECPTMLSRDYLFESRKDAVGNVNEPNYSQELIVAYHSLSSAGRTLETAFRPSKTFCFQRWFLALRIRVIGAVVDIFRVLSRISCEQENISDDAQFRKCSMVESLNLLQQITQISFQLKRLSQEFDLIAKSFIGMDGKSSEIIRTHALYCSLLAFSAGFALYNHSLPAYETLTCGLGCSIKYLKSTLIQNLAGRLWKLDRETSTKLSMLLEVSEQSKNCYHLLSTSPILKTSCEVKDIVDICNFAVSGLVCLHNEANNMHDGEILSKVTKNGLQLLADIILKWKSIPFRVPKYFFKVRPCFGSELFVSTADTSNLDAISVSTGFHLSLNLCLQLKNVPPNLPVRLAKLYCVLCCCPNHALDEQSKGQMPQGSHAWESSDMVDMNEKLFQYVTQCTKKTNSRKHGRDYDIDNDGGRVYAFVHFELNDRGQVFSTCLLDVSNFPKGGYFIPTITICMKHKEFVGFGHSAMMLALQYWFVNVIRLIVVTKSNLCKGLIMSPSVS